MTSTELYESVRKGCCFEHARSLGTPAGGDEIAGGAVAVVVPALAGVLPLPRPDAEPAGPYFSSLWCPMHLL